MGSYSYKEINDFSDSIKRFTDSEIASIMNRNSDKFNDLIDNIREKIHHRTGEITTAFHQQIGDEVELIILKEISRRWIILKEAIE